jgi:HK97 family phage major capsid protein
MASIKNWDSSIGEASSPEQWASFVLDHLDHESVLLASGARRIDTDSKLIHVPRLSDSGAADWYGELETIGPGDPVGDDLELEPKKIAALTTLSNEVVSDSNPSVLDTVGNAMVRAISLAADKALFVGGGSLAPEGFLNVSPALQNVPAAGGTITYAHVVQAGGSISAYGGRADSLYLSPPDYVSLQLQTAGDDRPLIQPDASQGGAATIAGFRVWPTPALGGGTAVVAQADQLVVAVRRDASVEFSTDAEFSKDATVARVVARVDGGVADARGVCTIGVT